MNRQNAAYCTGLLVQAGPEAAGPFMPQLLPALHHLFREQEAPGARDNAVGAVGRILSSMPQALPPLGQVLPVFLAALPLQVRVWACARVCGVLGQRQRVGAVCCTHVCPT